MGAKGPNLQLGHIKVCIAFQEISLISLKIFRAIVSAVLIYVRGFLGPITVFPQLVSPLNNVPLEQFPHFKKTSVHKKGKLCKFLIF